MTTPPTYRQKRLALKAALTSLVAVVAGFLVFLGAWLWSSRVTEAIAEIIFGIAASLIGLVVVFRFYRKRLKPGTYFVLFALANTIMLVVTPPLL